MSDEVPFYSSVGEAEKRIEFLEHSLSKILYNITNGKLSNPSTDPDMAIAILEDETNELVESSVKDLKVKLDEAVSALEKIDDYRCRDETTSDTNSMQVIARECLAKLKASERV